MPAASHARSASCPRQLFQLLLHERLSQRIIKNQIGNRTRTQGPAQSTYTVSTGGNTNTARNTSQLLRSRTGRTLIQLQISPRAILTQKNRAHIPHNAQLTQLTLFLRLKIAARIHVRRNRAAKSAHTKNSEVNVLLGMQVLLHATLTPHGGLGVRIVEERGNRKMDSLRIIGIHQLPQQGTQVRNTRMVRITGTIHLHHSHALQRTTRQMTRNLGHR